MTMAGFPLIGVADLKIAVRGSLLIPKIYILIPKSGSAKTFLAKNLTMKGPVTVEISLNP